MKKMLPIGKFSKLYGLDGEVIINFYSSFPGNLDIEEPLYARIDGLVVPLFMEFFQRRGQKGALIRFADIDNERRSSELLNQELFISSVDLDGDDKLDEGVLFVDDLVGFGAEITELLDGDGDERRHYQGQITAFVESEMNPLMVVEIEKREVLIPANVEFMEIDAETLTVYFTVPEGLLDL